MRSPPITTPQTRGGAARTVRHNILRRNQHLQPLAPRLSARARNPSGPRRPWSAAHGLDPSVFTIHAKKTRKNRASVSQTVASRGAPPLPARSLGPYRCCLRTIFARRIGCLREGEGSWAWTRRNLVCGSEIPGRAPGPGRPGSRRRSGAQVGVAVLRPARTAQRGSTGFRETDPWNCSGGEDPLPEPFRARLT